MNTCYKNVQTAAATANVTPLPQHLQDYFQLETSYFHSPHQILILIHVPCSSIDNIFTIYKYIPFPFPVFPSAINSNLSLSTIQELVNLEHQISPSQSMGLTIKADQPTSQLLFKKTSFGLKGTIKFYNRDVEFQQKSSAALNMWQKLRGKN